MKRLPERNVLDIVLMFGAKMGDLLSVFAVAPHAGAWVEIVDVLNVIRNNAVAPPAGARIEMRSCVGSLPVGGGAPLVGT